MKETSNYRPRSRISVIVVFVLFFVHMIPAKLPERDFHRIVGAHRWTLEELNTLAKGEILVRPLETDVKEELASIGVLRIRNLPAISMDKFRECLSQKGHEERTRSGTFSEPPTLDDLRTLELEPDAIEQLQRCTVGRCDLNLSAKMISRFQREIDWTSANAKSDATRLIEGMLVDYARDYLAKGDATLGTYDNRRKAVDLVASHRSLLSSSSAIADLAPEFVEYLEKFPRGRLANVQTSTHWAVVDFGLKPTITISHAVAYSQTTGESGNLFVASKQIYSSRYLDSSLTFTLLLRVVPETGVDSYLVFVDRSRSDALGGSLGGFARKMVQKESQQRIKRLLERVHVRLLSAGKASSKIDPGGEEGVTSWNNGLSQKQITVLVVGIIIVVLCAVLFVALRRPRSV
jgi:hypothetical protein